MRSTEVISARVPKERAQLLEEIAREEKVDKSTILVRALDHYVREWKIKKAIESYMNGSATLPKAAEIAGISVWEMIELLAERGIFSQYSIEDLEEDLRALKYEEEK